ncbi:MerR family DNA-binding transcriptional regulator [Proteobacteria bacterium 005FR1]|nr:MerR family DNA-binding transcriptional regulator [Proteobacteria bacterium 005FR1]
MNDAKQTFTISELAEEFGISARTLRFYEAEGLLSPQREGQRRIYSRRDYVRLKLILRGKRLGLSLAESQEIIDLYDREGGTRAQSELLREKIDEHRRQLQRKRRDISAMLRELDKVEALLGESSTDITTISEGK